MVTQRLPLCGRLGSERNVCTMRVEVDFDLCEANAVCMGIAPDIFEVDDDDNLHLHPGEVPAERQDDVRQAVNLCPKLALSLKNE